ncbi:hypothetical protein [Streptomyces sp. NPDC003077]
MDRLAEIVAAHEAERGALTEHEIEAARQELFGNVRRSGDTGEGTA